MASRTYLINCVPTEAPSNVQPNGDTDWSMNWKIPLFWYACFTSTDKIEMSADMEGGASYTAYRTDTKTAVANLNRRRESLIKLLPDELRKDYDALLDAFIARLGEDFQQAILLDPSDFFALVEFDPQAIETFSNEIALMELSPENGGAESLMDFPMSGAFDVGEEPAPSNTYSPESLATDWRWMLVGGPMRDDPSWPGTPSEAEIARATLMLSKASKANAAPSSEVQKPPSDTKKPWWKIF